MFEHLDGTTTGPGSFTGPLGNKLKDSENLLLVRFQAIQCNLPEISNTNDTDQRYLFEICQAISSGICSDGLKKEIREKSFIQDGLQLEIEY